MSCLNLLGASVNRKILLSFLVLFFTACNVEETSKPVAEQIEPGPEQILVHNARIYTMDPGAPAASAMLFGDTGKIHQVGDQQVMMDAFPAARRVDMNGKTVIPGLIDSHAHLYGLALSLSQAQLRDTSSKEEVIRSLREHEQHLSDGDRLLGRGCDQNDWPVREFPGI